MKNPAPPLLVGLLLSCIAWLPGPAGAAEIDEFLACSEPPARGFREAARSCTRRSGRVFRVRAVASGRVLSLSGAPDEPELRLQHTFYENARKHRLVSIYRGLTGVSARPEDLVEIGATLGRSSCQRGFELALELDDQPVDAALFLRSHARLFVPQDEAHLLLAHLATHQMALVQRGVVKRRMDIALGQGGAGKEWLSDYRTPRGMYFVVARHRGEFTGPWAEYFGGHWLKINYPNAFDARRGLTEGLITGRQRAAIEAAWWHRRPTPQGTRLGRNIGIHGWAHDWTGEDDGRRLSFGCVVMHNEDIAAIYDSAPVGAMVILF